MADERRGVVTEDEVLPVFKFAGASLRSLAERGLIAEQEALRLLGTLRSELMAAA